MEPHSYYNDLRVPHKERKRHSYLMLAVQLLEKGQKAKKTKKDIYKIGSNILKKIKQRW